MVWSYSRFADTWLPGEWACSMVIFWQIASEILYTLLCLKTIIHMSISKLMKFWGLHSEIGFTRS